MAQARATDLEEHPRALATSHPRESLRSQMAQAQAVLPSISHFEIASRKAYLRLPPGRIRNRTAWGHEKGEQEQARVPFKRVKAST